MSPIAFFTEYAIMIPVSLLTLTYFGLGLLVKGEDLFTEPINKFIDKNQKKLFLKRINKVNKKYKERLISKEKAIKNTKKIVNYCVNDIDFYDGYKKYLNFIKYAFSLQKIAPFESPIKKAIVSQLCFLIPLPKGKTYDCKISDADFELNNYKFLDLGSPQMYEHLKQDDKYLILNTTDNKKYIISGENLEMVLVNPSLNIENLSRETTKNTLVEAIVSKEI